MITLCANCRTAVRVLSPEGNILEGSQWFPNKYPCPKCSADSQVIEERLIPADILPLITFIDLTSLEAFVAYSGVGLPKEKEFTGEAIQQLLRETPIRRVVGEDVKGGSGRFILEYLELWDGTQLYFGASPAGAVIYRIKNRGSYVEE